MGAHPVRLVEEIWTRREGPERSQAELSPQQAKESGLGANPSDTFVSDFWPPEPSENKSPLLKPPRACSFVTAALANSHTHTKSFPNTWSSALNLIVGKARSLST